MGAHLRTLSRELLAALLRAEYELGDVKARGGELVKLNRVYEGIGQALKVQTQISDWADER